MNTFSDSFPKSY